jgi:hypothetical protein
MAETFIAPPETFRTGRTCDALSNEDPNAAFLEFMFLALAPGEWVEYLDDGFRWFPHRVVHSIQLKTIDYGDNLIKSFVTSDFLLGTIKEAGHGLSFVSWVNQCTVGAICWFDEETKEVHLTSQTCINVVRWWQCDLFADSVQRLVAIAERLSSCLEQFCDSGVPPSLVHSTLGQRAEPDQLLSEIGFDLCEPEFSSGFWFSENEVSRFQGAVEYLVSKLGGGMYEGESDSAEAQSMVRMSATYFLPPTELMKLVTGDVVAEVSARITNHPELGMGFERLIAVELFAQDSPVIAPDVSITAASIANVLNRSHCDSPEAETVMGPWMAWGDKIYNSLFIAGQPLRLLMLNSNGRVGDVLAAIGGPDDSSEIIDEAFRLLIEIGISSRRGRVADDGWAGIRQNANKATILVDANEATLQLIRDSPLNQILDEPLEVNSGHPLWLYRHDAVLASWGIFNPLGPSLGSLEVLINYSLGKGIIVERTIHFSGSMLRVHAVLDREGFNRKDDFGRAILAGLDWGGIDWCDIRTVPEDDDEHPGKMRQGLYHYAQRTMPDVLVVTAQVHALLASLRNPWIRINQPDLVSDYELSDDPWIDWVDIVAHPLNVDSHLKFLRGAWLGAKYFIRGADQAAYMSMACDHEWKIREGLIDFEMPIKDYVIEQVGSEKYAEMVEAMMNI